ncbi:AMP-binding protein, partial [Alphaproteobacteria bacterium]|nr:AMP-binding protein [Alphaproteobacteria bacterium]
MSTLVSKFFSAFETNNKCMLFDLSNQKGFSGQQLLDLIDQTASFLEQSGIQTGQRFICIADNNIETALILLTSMRHGFCVAMLPPNIENKSLLHQAKKIDVDVYIDTTSAYMLNDRENKKINFNTTDIYNL